jgi:hypothetical protein
MSDSDTLLTTRFVFDASADTSGVKNVLMVHSGASELQQYANADTFVIVYDHSADRETVLSTLMDRFTHLDRIAFAFHYTETRTLLLNNQEWFTDADLDPSNTLSENAQFVLDLLTRFSVPHLDVLACNTLNDFAWKQYYDRVYAQTGVIIGASDNNTGNLKYGGDWVLESTHTDVQSIYFTEAIANYSALLVAITISGITYTSSSASTAYISSTTGVTGAVVIPSTVVMSSTTYTVTAIGTTTTAGGSGAFENNTNITSVVIPSTVTLIGKFAFRNCTNLATVSLSDGLDTIQSNAFDNCDSITRMIFPSSVSNIIPYSFFGTSNLAEIYIYGSPLIGNNAFQGCKGTTIVVLGPAKLSNYSFNCWLTTTIYLNSGVSMTNDPFAGVNASSVTVYSNSSALSLANSTVLASKTVNVLSTSLNNIQYRTIGMPTANTAAVNYAPNISGSVIIPENVVFGQTAYTITEIDPMAFAGNDGITSVYFSPSCSISNIGTMSFMGCANLSSVVLPNNTTNIAPSAFDGCIHLTSASIPIGLLTIGGKAFQNSGLVSVSIPSSVSAFGANMFYLCSDLTTATLNNNPTVDANTFFRCSNLTSVATLSTSTNVISGVGTNYTSVACVVKDAATNVCYTIPAGTASNGSIFVSASPNATGSVSISATYTINSVSYNVTSIAANAFQGCNGITSISLPNSIRSVGDYAFLGCTGLTTLTSGASGASFITGGATGQRLGVQCFAYCTSLTSVSVPSTYTVIGEYTFLNCSVLTTVSIPSVAGITNTTGGNAFYGTAITSLTNV